MTPTLAVIAPEQFAPKGMDGVDGIESIAITDAWDSERGFTSIINGLFIYADKDVVIGPGISKVIEKALESDIPILGSDAGMHLLNVALGGDAARRTPTHALDDQSRRNRNSIFLAPGAKVSSTIGGSGWLSINCDHKDGIAQSGLAPAAMPAAISDDRVVEAFEMPGHRWVIGVQWDVFGATRMPRGFDNILLAFVERVIGE